MAQAEVREYAARASSTDTFGRVMCNSRDHYFYFVVDGPVQNGCPGEAITPAELFLAGAACCGVELVQVLAKAKAILLDGVAVDIQGSFDRSRPVRPDVTLFNSVHLHFRMKGVTEQQAGLLVEGFKGR
jgi:uncharacterized OsmC-like protein